jgi:phage-related baseplate assembly protein
MDYAVEAVLYVYPGPATEPMLAAAKVQLTYINEQRRLGRDIRRSAIYAALHVKGVQRVELINRPQMWYWIKRRPQTARESK